MSTCILFFALIGAAVVRRDIIIKRLHVYLFYSVF